MEYSIDMFRFLRRGRAKKSSPEPETRREIEKPQVLPRKEAYPGWNREENINAPVSRLMGSDGWTNAQT